MIFGNSFLYFGERLRCREGAVRRLVSANPRFLWKFIHKLRCEGRVAVLALLVE
jgi:hypothetical protein